MYAGTGISSDSARRHKAKRSARWIASACRRLFHAKPLPDLAVPAWTKAQINKIPGLTILNPTGD
jgi:hypothetical protein